VTSNSEPEVETKKKWQFSKIWHSVWDAKISPASKLVYSAIDWHGKEAFPSQGRLAKMTGLSVDTIQKAVAELKRRGFLETVRRRRRAMIYILNPEGGRKKRL